MAIVFKCPHCKTDYRLKDEYAGMTATCKNPNCRKIIPIPAPTKATGPAQKVDVDALAAALFSDAAVDKPAGAEEMIEVTCAGCDHVWQVEASREGKNVLCPECRKQNRVPFRKKQEKADWRTGGSGLPSLAKVETGLDVEGAFATAQAGGISTQTAKEIVRDRDAQEEPEERRKKLIKRGITGFVVIAVLSAGTYYLVKQKKMAAADAKMEDAVKELTGENGTQDPRFVALIHRASGEYRARTANSEKETIEARKDLQTARNKFPTANPATQASVDQNGVLVEIAITMTELLGTSEQVASGTRLKKEEVLKEIRQTLQHVHDTELCADALRVITRKAVAKGQPSLPGEVARQMPKPDEMLGRVGLEMMRIDRENLRPEVEKLLASFPSSNAPAMIALRAILHKPGAKKEGEAQAVSLIASAEADAFKGDTAGILGMLRAAKPEDRVIGLAAAAGMVIDTKPADAIPLLQAAAKEAREAKAYGTPWVAIRICRLLAQAGQFEPAEALAASLADSEAKAWARLEILRGHLAAAKASKADEAWLDPIGDPTKQAAAAKAREEVARHNAAAGVDYPAMTLWEKGKVRPFGIAGTLLGKEDRKQQK